MAEIRKLFWGCHSPSADTKQISLAQPKILSYALKMEIEFLGAAQTVTGSRTLVKDPASKMQLLIDCGLFQGPKPRRLLNWNPVVDPKTLDAILLTHAHTDHSGLLPRLVKMGYAKPIYCSEATADLCRILLMDSAHLQEEDAEYANHSRYSKHSPALALYDKVDAAKTLDLLRPVKSDVWHELHPHLQFRFLRAGHILGSSLVQLLFQGPHGPRTITFSGDLGNGRSLIIKPPVTIAETDFLVLESTYGDRVQPRSSPFFELQKVILKVAKRGGVLVIPAFSVGRTQELLYLITQLENQNAIPKIPVYLDSPLSKDATEIFLSYPDEHQLTVANGQLVSPICTSCFKSVQSLEESIRLHRKEGPMIVISASGMLSGGRVMHHLKHRLPDPKNGLLFVGYQAEGTKGRLIQAGLNEIRIHHQPVPIRAEIFTIESLSAHADSNDLLEWLRHLKRAPAHVFLNHGEPQALTTLKAKIEEELNFAVTIPEFGEKFELGNGGIIKTIDHTLDAFRDGYRDGANGSKSPNEGES